MKKIQKKVFITRSDFPYGHKLLQEAGFQLDFYQDKWPISEEKLCWALENYDYIISQLTDPFKASSFPTKPKTKLIAQNAVGFNNIDISSAKKHQITISNTPDVLSFTSAETAFMLMQILARKLIPLYQSVYNNQFLGFDPFLNLGLDLRNKTLGIVGMGRIGQEMAKMAESFYQMDIIYHSRTDKNVPYQKVAFEKLLKQSDVVSIHTDLNESSRNLFNEDVFLQMKDTAILINTARGEVINQDDLLKVLHQGKFHGVGLDVTCPEPLDNNHPLKKIERVVITPHIGSGSDRTRQEMGELCAKNIIEFEKSQKALTPIKI